MIYTTRKAGHDTYLVVYRDEKAASFYMKDGDDSRICYSYAVDIFGGALVDEAVAIIKAGNDSAMPTATD